MQREREGVVGGGREAEGERNEMGEGGEGAMLTW